MVYVYIYDKKNVSAKVTVKIMPSDLFLCAFWMHAIFRTLLPFLSQCGGEVLLPFFFLQWWKNQIHLKKTTLKY